MLKNDSKCITFVKENINMGRKVGYARVSSKEQNLDRQVKALMEYVEEDMIVTEKASGIDLNRPGYMSLKIGIGKLRAGDELYIKSLDRLSRNKEDIKKELEYFSSIGVRVKVIDIPTTMIDMPKGQEWIIEMANNIIFEVLASFAEVERETTKRRQAEGIKAMKVVNGKKISNRTGNPIGRPSIQYPNDWDEIYNMWKSGKITAKEAMKKLNLKRTSFYKLVKLQKQKDEQLKIAC